jgi:spermidine/putrescine transport system permease protein
LIRIYTFLVYVFMFAPIVVVIVLAFNPKQFGIFPMEGVSLRWFIKLAQNESIIEAFQNSLVLGSLTAVISTGIGILAALAFIRFEFPGKNTLNTLLLSPIMIPEVVLGVALLLFLRFLQQPKSFAAAADRPRGVDPALCAADRPGRLVGIKKEYEEAAKSLGANAFQTFREVTFPLLLPAILAGALFSFTISFDDITATLFWATAQNQTVPVKIFSMLRNSISPEINALGAVMIVLTVATPCWPATCPASSQN